MIRRVFVFFIGFLCAAILFSVYAKKVPCQNSIPDNISFSTQNNSMYFLDKDTATIYIYNNQGRLMRTFIINELGKNLTLAY